MKYDWNYGENDYQKYYDVTVGEDHLCVFSNRWQPDIWMAMVKGKMIYNKTANDIQRKKQGLKKGCSLSELGVITILSSNNPEYMMEKTEWCYTHNLKEISI